jgi:glycosyltransferase involved in cell wall biosynthesis
MTSISVVIPTCDRLDFLKETVQCVIEQSRPADEIIVVNNGNAPLPQGYLPENIKVLELAPYVGVSRARNEGVAVASGEYIAFQDDDDLWEKDYLKKVEDIINERHPDCIVSRLDKMVNGTVLPYKNAHNKLTIANLFVFNPGVGGQSTIVKKDSFISVGGFDINLPTSEDKSLIIEFILGNYAIVTAPNIQAIQREHNELRLTGIKGAEKAQIGVSKFLNKYKAMMTLAQRNYNTIRVCRFKYYTSKKLLYLMNYKLRCKINRLFQLLNSKLPNPPHI